MDDEKINPEDLHFYYNREERIKRAPEQVRSYYDGTLKQPPKGFFKALVHTKSSRFLLGSIVLLVIMILFVTNFEVPRSSASVEDVHFELSAFLFEDTVFVTLKANEASVDSDYTVSAYFNALNVQEEILEQASIHSIFSGNENFYRTTFSKYDIIKIDCTVYFGESTLQLQTDVQE